MIIIFFLAKKQFKPSHEFLDVKRQEIHEYIFDILMLDKPLLYF